jgi:iron complex outermembrane recepter protein
MKISVSTTRLRAVVGCFALVTSTAGFDAFAQERDKVHGEHDIDEIVVKGAPLDRTIKELAQPTAMLTGEALDRKQASSLGETLAHELGVTATYFGPVSSRPVIRGQYGERVLVLSNSLDSLDASALSEDHAVSVDDILAERVEIVRGPATLLYGSGAAGGLVNVVDERIIEEPLDRPFGGALSLGSDSTTDREAAAAQVAFGSESVAMHLDYFRRNTGDVEIPGQAESAILRAMEGEEHDEEDEAHGVVENTDSKTEGGAAAITLTNGNGYLGFSASQYDSKYGIPGHQHHDEEEEEEENVRVDLAQTRYEVRGGYDFVDGDKLVFRLAKNDYEHVELEGGEIGTQFDTDGLDTRLEYRHRRIGNMEGAFGVQHKSIDFVAIGDEAFVPPSDTRQTSVFGFEEWTLDGNWILQASARMEKQAIDAPGLPGYDGEAFGGSLGLIWAMTDGFSVALNYALTERHPNSTELYADGPHVAANRIERGFAVLGNGILDKELSSNVDLTFRGDNERIEWTVTGFVNSIDDYILLSPTSAIEDELQVFEYGQTDATLYGFEAEARVELFDSDPTHVHARIFTDFVYGEDDRTGNYLPRIPPLRYGVGIHYTVGGFEAGVEAEFNEAQRKTAPNELPTDGYTLLSAELSYGFAEPNVFLFLRGTNLSDEDARRHASPLKDTVPLPGRSLQLGLRYYF